MPLRLPLLVLLAAAAVFVPTASRGADDETGGGSARADVRTATGKIGTIDARERKITIDADGGPVILQFDRNTSVYLDDRMGTVRDLVVGASVRASYGAERLAYWIEVRSRAALPGQRAQPDGGAEAGDGRAPADAGGTAAGPPVLPPPGGEAGAAPATRGAGADGGSAPDAGAPPGAGPRSPPPASPGPPSPEPVAPRRPSPPGPTGPGPVPGG